MTSVLIVEDDLSIADLLQEALEADGYDVCAVARTVEAAIEAARGVDLDFAVIDIHLADGGLGTEVGAHLRQTTRAGIIFSTGNDNIANLTTHEGDAVMTKPYRLRDMGRSLKIIDEIAHSGKTGLAFPRSFRLLEPPEMAAR
jgi:DNA-binding response OmpR family regulator